MISKSLALLIACLVVTTTSLTALAENAKAPTKEAAAKGKKGEQAQKVAGDPRSLALNERGVAQIKDRQFAQAEETFKQALKVDSGNITAAYNLASVYLINKKEEAAITILNDYIKVAPQDGSLYVRLGDAHFGLKQIDKARTAYEQAWKLDPDFDELAAKLGTVYLLENKPVEAEKMLENATAKSPKDGKLAANLSSVYLANGKPEQAVAAAKKALQVKATKEVYVTLATAYEILKDYKNSLISFQRAADLGDNRDEIQKKIEGLKKVTS